MADGKYVEDGQRGLVLGLAPDINNVGCCLIDPSAQKIVRLGVHRFAPPLDPKTKVSLARKRRQLYYIRINKRRTRYRAKAVLRVLADFGLVPDASDASWLQSVKGDKPIPQLRVEGLDRRLSSREVAQVLYYFALHRGYDPRGESSEGDVESKRMLSEIAKTAAALEAGEARTAGELFAKRGRMRNRGGGWECTATRDMVEAEVRAIIANQASQGTLSAEFEEAYIRELLYTRSTSATDAKTYERVGYCKYFPRLRRAARADVTTEMLSALQTLKHLRIVEADGTEHALTHAACMAYLDVMFSCAPIPRNKGCVVRYADVLRDHARGEGAHVKGVLDKDVKREVYAPKAFALMRKSGVPEALLARMVADRELGDFICEALTYASGEDVLLERLAACPRDLSESELDAILALPYATRAFSGYASRSLMAEGMLLSALIEPEVGSLYAAEEACGLYETRAGRTADESPLLLPPFIEYDRTCTNPVVLRTTSRMRRIVNAIIKRYGVPAEVRVLLGRELKQSKKERLNAQRYISENRKRRAELAERAAALLGVEPETLSGSLMRKLALWRSQGGIDVLAGREIDFDKLVRGDLHACLTYILPPSLTGETGMGNSLLVLTSTGESKGALTPVQWCESGRAGAPSIEELKARVAASQLPYAKKARILTEDVRGKAPALLDRTVNDTRYMSRAFRGYLEAGMPLLPDGTAVRASAVSDRAMAELRRAWGLRDVFTGDLSDLDPAVEAAVAAVCDAATVRRCAAWSASRLYEEPDRLDVLLRDSLPWPGFADQLRARVAFVVPTRMHDHGMTGEALEATDRSLTAVDAETGYAEVAGSSRAIGNYRVSANGTLRIVGGMAALRLWHDPEAPAARARKGKGRYYVEPVYYIDVPHMDDEDFEPRYQATKLARGKWPVVPEAARLERPVVLHPGDVVSVRGRVGRYAKYSISNGSWSVLDIRTGAEIKGFPTIGSICDDDSFKVVEEDALGFVWDDYLSGPAA